MSELRFFQYIAGERRGDVVVFSGKSEDDGMTFIDFKDGGRCNEDLILPINRKDWEGKLMAEVSDVNNIWRFEEKWVGRQEERRSKPEDSPDGKSYIITPYKEGKQTWEPIPPQRVNIVDYENRLKGHDVPVTPVAAPEIQSTQEIIQPAVAPKPQPVDDPVWNMMEAAKKFPTAVGVELEIMLPKKSLFDVANESFDGGGEKVIEYIIENLDISKLKDALRESLYEAYDAVLPEEEETVKEEDPAQALFAQPLNWKKEEEEKTGNEGIAEETVLERPMIPEKVEEFVPEVFEPVADVEPEISGPVAEKQK